MGFQAQQAAQLSLWAVSSDAPSEEASSVARAGLLRRRRLHWPPLEGKGAPLSAASSTKTATAAQSGARALSTIHCSMASETTGDCFDGVALPVGSSPH